MNQDHLSACENLKRAIKILIFHKGLKDELVLNAIELLGNSSIKVENYDESIF